MILTNNNEPNENKKWHILLRLETSGKKKNNPIFQTPINKQLTYVDRSWYAK